MKINPALSGTSNVLALIAADNPNFQFSEVVVKVTGVTARLLDDVPYNTTATVEGVNPDEFYNPVSVFYNRRSMLEAVPSPTAFFQVDTNTSFDDILAIIATQLKLVQSQVQLTNLQTIDGSTVSTAILSPIANSPIYIPEQLAITLAWSADALDAVQYFGGASLLHTFMNVTLPAPGYF